MKLKGIVRIASPKSIILMRNLPFIILCGVIFYCQSLQANEKLSVVVSIMPQKYFVEQVGGDKVDVKLMVGPGHSPATYEPTLKQIAEIEDSQLYFSIGVPFERAWLSTIQRNNPGLRVINMGSHSVNETQQHHLEHDPHVWLNPNNAMHMTKLIADELIALDGNHAEHFQQAAEVFISKLVKLDTDIESQLSHLSKRDLIVAHPAWSVYAEQYNLTQHSIEQHGKEIQAASMTDLIELAREKQIKAVFSQPQFNNKAAKIIAAEIGAVVISLDPLAYHYLDNMREVTAAIVSGLSQ